MRLRGEDLKGELKEPPILNQGSPVGYVACERGSQRRIEGSSRLLGLRVVGFVVEDLKGELKVKALVTLGASSYESEDLKGELKAWHREGKPGPGNSA